MSPKDLPARFKRLEIPGRVTFQEGNGELPMIEVVTPESEAELYLHGAQVTHFQKKNEEPILFLSKVSRFAENQAIRGGVPFIFPWFGPREGEPSHGFARLTSWELEETTVNPDQSIRLRFTLPASPEAASFPPFALDYHVTVGRTLKLDARIQNLAPDADFPFEVCLHTYFSVGHIQDVSVIGLHGATYLDQADNFARKTETAPALQIASEVDRIYLDTTSPVEIRDRSLRRSIRIDKSGSASTVVWNPWITKAQQMPDFGSDEYQHMLCVESGNVASNKITLLPGQSSALSVELSSAPLA